MFQCDSCDKYIEDGCKIYIVKEGMVINGEDDNLEIEEKGSIYCSALCLAIDFDP